MSAFLSKKGLLEVLVPFACCGLFFVVGPHWTKGLILAVVLLVLFAITACIVNYACLQPQARERWITCVLQPYTTLMMLVPYVLILSGLERGMRVADMSSQRPQSNFEPQSDHPNRSTPHE
ncbi:hypothetical protein [Cobetia marina]|uniref:hypothetical protein n=1 Tax=Cobetia marina TaxID=28258 RepID=UPI003A94547E